MVRGHQLQRLRAQQPDAAKFAAVEQRAAEGEIVSRSRAQSATARDERWRRKERTLGRIVLQRQVALAFGGERVEAALGVGRIARRKAMRLVGRHEEIGVVHAERIEDALLQELLERHAADPAYEIADDVG